MKQEKVLLTVAVIAVLVSLVAASITYLSVASLVSEISGYVTSTGEANLTVEAVALINFTTITVDWGSGRVNDGVSAASLTTYPTDNVTGGNWTLETVGGLRIENIGNTNVSLNLSGSKTAAQFIGGTSPVYEWNITEVEGSSCLNATGCLGCNGTLPLNIQDDVNTTAARVCDVFQFLDASDLMRIDFNLTVPSDSLTGALTDTITATAFVV